jgi:AcrR family transcriptional regulator
LNYGLKQKFYLLLETDRKTQIIKAAVKRFARHGLNKTTLDEIARDLRIGKATIYYYFKSKDELFFETIIYDSDLILNDIKTIFNNDSLPLKERFANYFIYKENIYEKYKLIYDLMANLLNDSGFETELEILKKLLKFEESVLRIALSSALAGKSEKMHPTLPSFLVMASWGMLFSDRFNKITSPERELHTKDFLIRSLETILK